MITANLTGKTALVTGGGSGIGLATVELLLASGATVGGQSSARRRARQGRGRAAARGGRPGPPGRRRRTHVAGRSDAMCPRLRGAIEYSPRAPPRQWSSHFR